LTGIFRTHLGRDLAGTDLRAAALAARGHTGGRCRTLGEDRTADRADLSAPHNLQDLLDAVRDGKPELPTELRRLLAYHEAGQAILHRLLGTAEPMWLAVGADGGVTECALGALRASTRAHLERSLVALLGGRAAEQVVFGEVTAGSAGSPQSDLARANRLALRLETQYRFGDLGLLSLSDNPADEDLLRNDWLRRSVRATIDRAYAAAAEALERNRASAVEINTVDGFLTTNIIRPHSHRTMGAPELRSL
jgi:cell division protease FtsH